MVNTFSSRFKPRCFWWLAFASGMALKIKGMWLTLWVISEKTISWAFLDTSGFKSGFHLWAFTVIFSRLLFNCGADKLES